MNKFRFLSYHETPSVEGQKGIASVLFMDEVILRFKLVMRKDGQGYFVAPATLKGEPQDEKSTWVDAFTLERNSVKDELIEFIRHNVRTKSVRAPLGSTSESFNEELPF